MEADIVYVDNDLLNGRPPCIGTIYKLVLATATSTRTPIEGVQLRLDDSPSGWIREYHKTAIIDSLKVGLKCYCVVSHKKKFVWNKENCFWGAVKWWIDLTGEGDEDEKE